jgi:hypothetical protein
VHGFLTIAERWTKFDYVFDMAEEDEEFEASFAPEIDVWREERVIPEMAHLPRHKNQIARGENYWIVRRGREGLLAGIVVEWCNPPKWVGDDFPFFVHFGIFRKTGIPNLRPRNASFPEIIERVGFGVTIG